MESAFRTAPETRRVQFKMVLRSAHKIYSLLAEGEQPRNLCFHDHALLVLRLTRDLQSESGNPEQDLFGLKLKRQQSLALVRGYLMRICFTGGELVRYAIDIDMIRVSASPKPFKLVRILC
ncbi:unnamed protein product [Prorocentrum cordatum]|uniref:Uncharacterized protein n=1 Tax=Prorocentrum cordatum TaxID=2364126 RepID=A0ABN9RM13_9DINO|nr:unnamed protein product [Polarella glacialis]